ncbi:two-component response regulator ARR2 [Geobacter sp. OR-1]|uniref:response regulator n=1 Tax=Geobacter sp. OR-1 TaxID=1266765 RepID=UPI0005428E26|nr:response regulator [Geobacter sp. OR-1]GAM11059.1 two-component response regulator ARR2 [Geobacter sp. OR-1]
MGKILIVDDDPAFLKLLSAFVEESYPLLQVMTCSRPVSALNVIREGGLDLLVLDLEMPDIDGAKLFNFAVETGMDPKRIVILSGRDADYLHANFPLGTCLAVLNKYEVKQKAVLEMVFSSLNRKAEARQEV